jgi:pyruvate-ferredoxin/flavodoxin oxidoreductase
VTCGNPHAVGRSDPERARHLFALAQADVDERWHYYEQLAGVERSMPQDSGEIEVLVADSEASEDLP